MRFLLLPLAAVAAVAAPRPAAKPTAPPNPLVILVHGRGHLDDDSAALRRDWKRDLDSALALVGMPKLRDEDVRLAWYADVLDPNSEVSCKSERTGATASIDDDSLDFGIFARGLFSTLTSNLAKDESRGLRGLIGDMLFVVDGSKRCAAERRIGQAIENAATERRPVVIIAYSLGSLVTFGYLNAHATTTLPDVRLITMGSPLGVRELRELMLGEIGDTLRVPRNVRTWENVVDPYDVFSAPLERIVSPRMVRDRIIGTGSDSQSDTHQIDHYLRDRATGAALARAICATSKERIGACERVAPN